MESSRIQTRSTTKIAANPDVGETDPRNHSNDGMSESNNGTKSKLSNKKTSLTKKSKASSTAARLKIEAQIKADEALARILEQEKIIIQNRLAYEKDQIDENYLEQSEVGSGESENTDDVKLEEVSSSSKVRNWLHDQKIHEPSISKYKENQNPTKNEERSIQDKFEMLFSRQTIDKDLPIYSGDVKEWPLFFMQYKSTTEMLKLSSEENLCRLRKCLTGDAKRCVEGLLLSATSLDKIMEILKNRFGRPDLIIKSMVNDAEMLPFVRNNDFKALTHLSETIANLVATLDVLNMKNYLDCPQLLEKLLQKLPYSMQLSWGEKMSLSSISLNLKDFSEWVWKRSEAASYVQAINKPSTNIIDKSKYPGPSKYRHAFVTTQEKTKTKKSFLCKFCNIENHTIDKCDQFSKLDTDEKWNFVVNKKLCFCCLKGAHRITHCFRKKLCDIEGCQKFHHNILHVKEKVSEPDTTKHEEIVAYTRNYDKNIVLLKVAPVKIKANGKEVETYALFDEAATVTLLDEEIANQLKIQGDPTNLGLRWTDRNSSKSMISRKINLTVSGSDGKDYNLKNVYTMKDLDLPVQNVNLKSFKDKWPYLKTVNLPEISFMKPRLLIGQDNWELIVSREIIEGPKNAPAISKTKLGWIVHGNIENFKGMVDNSVLFIKNQDDEDLKDLHEQIKTFFSFESYGLKNEEKYCDENKQAEILMESSTRKTERGWEVGLLWKDRNGNLPESKHMALQRLMCIERRMDNDDEFAQKYKRKIDEYLEKQYCRILAPEEIENSHADSKIWYIPHFGVINENKPEKLRLVFDAAAKVDGKCLNDFLLKGPDLFNSLTGIIWKFRQKNIAFCSDIQDMFHQIQIREEDQNAQRFLWRNFERKKEPDVYCMKVLIFGAVSSPFCAQYIRNKNAMEFIHEVPDAVEAIINKHYMDDYLDSVNDEKQAITLVKEVIDVHSRGGFKIRGWTSNSMAVLESIPVNLRANTGTEQDILPQRVLGLKWSPNEDTLSFPLNFHKIKNTLLLNNEIPTKREILRIIMSIYDPLGLLGNFLVRSKIMMQEIWRSGIQWDQKIPEYLQKKWLNWLDDLRKVKTLKIPRCYMNNNEGFRLQQHVFCDASQQAVATVSYFRFSRGKEKKISLVTSKTQVAPMKHQTSVPKLELQAALFATRIAKKVIQEHTLHIEKTYFWTDSKTVIQWIRNENIKITSYVSHRIKEIRENSDKNQWHWIPTKINIADEATRDTKEMQFEDSRWFDGPEFLYLDEELWPKEVFEKKYESNLQITLITSQEVIDYLPNENKFLKWIRLLRSTIYVLRFARKNRKFGEITVEEIEEAEKIWCKKVQIDSFAEDYRLLKRNKTIADSSRLLQLSVVFEDGLLKVGGRTDLSSELSEEAKHPIILDSKHKYTQLLIKHYHEKYEHRGREMIINELRQKFWILQMRRAVNKTMLNCNFCRIRRAKPVVPEMGQLPEIRLKKPPRAFTFVGMDYFGPFTVSIGRRSEKRYGVLFTCLSIRAIHIEIAESLSTDSCILALRRFIARRGEPQVIMSDNGSNMKAADKEIKESLKNIDKNLIERDMVSRNIEWKFICPASPHMGGAWERMVRAVKQSLKITLRDKTTKQEVFATFMAEAENIVNSRPLTYVSNNPDDPESITPNHFLIGTSSSAKPPGVFDDKLDLRKQWRYSQKLADNFWNRWVCEYLPTLTRRTKWLKKRIPLEPEDLVVIADNRLPRNNWPLGKIIATYPGKDKQVRVADVKTKTGIYRRPVAKLCKLSLFENVDEKSKDDEM